MNTFKMMTMIMGTMILFAGCTFAITLVHTQGFADDVVDETSDNRSSASVIPTFSIPSKLI